ncbi:MAG: F0F1 ATP synthase subunit B [Deltaproteobacteria bacterium]|jgi:F-type H+-transporting ATPase subunit b|nr:F0F1 ATP synthase subunit B [Deltaproteobacteria bacterium]MBW2478729.1 F0F1 ATP synthase subunit B [Deltaproteobacteria bacterium]
MIWKKTLLAGSCFLACFFILHLTAFEVLAAENSGGWRPVFDLVMRWVNFLLLAFLLIKFSRAPIKKFLEGKKQEIADEIGELEAEKDEMLRQIDESKQQLKDSRERLAELKARIIAQGERNRQQIIEDAEQESKLMLKSAQQKMASRIIEARQKLKMELVDSAIAIATDMLPEKITAEDNQKFIDAFISGAASK